MTITHFEKFLKMNEGKWLTQSTIYDLNTNKKVSIQSQIISTINNSQPRPLEIEDILKAKGSSFINLTTISSNNVKNTSYNYFLDPKYNKNIKGFQGKLIRYEESSNVNNLLEGHFVLQADGSCILNSKYKDFQIYEKYHFTSNNLRLYVNITKQFGFSVIIAFNSDIRI